MATVKILLAAVLLSGSLATMGCDDAGNRSVNPSAPGPQGPSGPTDPQKNNQR